MDQRLMNEKYLTFPFRMSANGPVISDRIAHVREQIEQVLFTNPGERVFRPDFGAGIKALVFEPNVSTLWEITQRRIIASLIQALRGEVDPKSIQVEVKGAEEKLLIIISYSLVAINVTEKYQIPVDRR
jgi:uncharacterized protein